MRQRIKHLYQFGSFRIDPGKQLPLRTDDAFPLVSKVFDLLLVQVHRVRRSCHAKDELMKTVWPDSFVEESNLRKASSC